MLTWKRPQEIRTEKEALNILLELKKQGIKVYYLDWLQRLVFNPRDKKIKVITGGRIMEGIGPAMARALGIRIADLLGVKNNKEFKKIWDGL